MSNDTNNMYLNYKCKIILNNEIRQLFKYNLMLKLNVYRTLRGKNLIQMNCVSVRPEWAKDNNVTVFQNLM